MKLLGPPVPVGKKHSFVFRQVAAIVIYRCRRRRNEQTRRYVVVFFGTNCLIRDDVEEKKKIEVKHLYFVGAVASGAVPRFISRLPTRCGNHHTLATYTLPTQC
jgi:hypothetical protein